jgi:predicted transcriptional regulator
LEGERQQDIFDWLQENGSHSPTEIFKGMKDDGYEGSPVTLRVILSKMTDKGILQKQGHEYFIKFPLV